MHTRWACSIQLQEKVILTGGQFTATMVTVYNTEGWVEELPRLNQGRYRHGCGHFVNTDNKEVSDDHITIPVKITMSSCPGVPRSRWQDPVHLWPLFHGAIGGGSLLMD